MVSEYLWVRCGDSRLGWAKTYPYATEYYLCEYKGDFMFEAEDTLTPAGEANGIQHEFYVTATGEGIMRCREDGEWWPWYDERVDQLLLGRIVWEDNEQWYISQTPADDYVPRSLGETPTCDQMPGN